MTILHCLILAGVLSLDKKYRHHCQGDYLLPVKSLSMVFREKYLVRLKTSYGKKELKFPGQIASLGTAKGFKSLIDSYYNNRWVVNIRKPIDKPEYVLDYLGRYTHRVAISNNRLIALENNRVRFSYKNRKTNEPFVEDIDAIEFIRRFMLQRWK